MSDERERDEVGRQEVGRQEVGRQGTGDSEPDFEGHANRAAIRWSTGMADRQDSGEPDFEGHRHIEKNAERNEP